MARSFEFTRFEFSGSLGDLGTILPLAVGMIVINDIDPVPVFTVIGLFYIFSGLYFKLTCPVEPMKVISGYAIATGISAIQIQASCFWIGIFMLLIGGTGLIDFIGRYIGRSVIRGVQLSTGILLISQGIRLMAGSTLFQSIQGAAEPHLAIQSLGILPIGILLGSLFAVLTLMLLDNRLFPAALVIVLLGILLGLVFGKDINWSLLSPGLHLPKVLPYGLPKITDLGFALIILTLPQLPMTIGNAVIANRDLSLQYFKEKSELVTNRRLCLSMALANALSFIVGGIPLCHGAGGLASRYRFGARTGGSNLIIGTIFIVGTLLLGPGILTLINLLPFSILGVLLVFSGSQLGITARDLSERREMFVAILIVGITLSANLAVGFIAGIAIEKLLAWKKLSI